jgi:hypothetical protein
MSGPRRSQGRDHPRRANGTAPEGRARARGRGEPVSELCTLSPFSVFCALHLGITEDDGYARQERACVARRFGLSPEQLDEYLAEHRLRDQDLRAIGFELASARLDMQVAPTGISRMELARGWFEELAEGLAQAGAQRAGE